MNSNNFGPLDEESATIRRHFGLKKLAVIAVASTCGATGLISYNWKSASAPPEANLLRSFTNGSSDDGLCAGIRFVNNCGLDTFLHVTGPGMPSHIINPGCVTYLGPGFRAIVGGKDKNANASGNTLFEGSWNGPGHRMYVNLSAMSGFNVPVKMEGNGRSEEISSAASCGGERSGVFPCNYGQNCGAKGPNYNPSHCVNCNEHCCDHIPNDPVGNSDCGTFVWDPVQYPTTVTFCQSGTGGGGGSGGGGDTPTPSGGPCEDFCHIDWGNRNAGRHCAPGDMADKCGGCDYCSSA